MAATTLCLETTQFPGPSSGNASRAEILADARRGDAQAFTHVVLPYAPGLYRRALRITGNPADAEDARQEALLKAFSRLGQFAGTQDNNKDDLHAWISRIAANASIDLIRQRRGGKLLPLEDSSGPAEDSLVGQLAAREENPEDSFARREMRSLLATAIARLARDLRQVCLLRDVLQYSTQEVAERLGISTVAVRLRLFRAHRRLREDLHHAMHTKKQKQQRTIVPVSRTGSNDCRSRLLPLSSLGEFACGD
jgi:RNA polymerase sigma-70 factor, ECF subfamily